MRPPLFSLLRKWILVLIASSGFNRIAGILATPSRWGRKPCPDIKHARAILVVKADELGDVVLATGFLRALRRACPEAHITVAVRPMNLSLISKPEMADVCLPWNDAWQSWAFSYRSWRALVLQTRRTFAMRRPDWALIPRGCPDHRHMALFAWWSGAARVCAHKGFCIESGNDRSSLVSDIVPDLGAEHETTLHRRMLEYLGLDETDITPCVQVDEATRKKIAHMMDRGHSRRIALGIGAGASDRIWPESHFSELLKLLLPTMGETSFIVVGGTAESEAGDRLVQLDPDRIINGAGRLSIQETAAVLETCAVFVGNDSGPMHLAATMGCAIVEITKHPLDGDDHSAHSPVRFGPLVPPPRVRILHPPGQMTIDHVPPTGVAGAVRELLENKPVPLWQHS